MRYLIGTDEAGYGPNLGPLVITATAWQVPDHVAPETLYARLAGSVCSSRTGDDDHRLPIADSKQLYVAGGGLQSLELGVMTALRLSDSPPNSWRQAWRNIAELTDSQLDSVPWHHGYDPSLPLECGTEQIEQVIERVRRDLEQAEVRLAGVRARAVFPGQFNELLDRHGNKAALLSDCTLRLAARLMELGPETPVVVTCDKHGGRNRYGSLLQTLFPDYLVEIVREARELSVYRWGPPSRRVEFRFMTQGERMLPTALASMVSKYLRELAMRAFNDYWLREVPGIRPTAGYPVDARRFQRQIASRQLSLGIPDGDLWRAR